MEESVGLPGDSPIRECLFNIGSEGWCPTNLVSDPEKGINPLCAHTKIHPP